MSYRLAPSDFGLSLPAANPEPVAWYIYVGFVAFVVMMLLVDLKLFHTEAREPTIKESATWVGIWISLAAIFGFVVLAWKGPDSAIEYVTGYLVEYSLSVDNIFVFLVIFSYFRVPREFQHQVLFWGILGAIIFRGVFIGIGVALISRFDWILYVFGVLLIVTAIRIGLGSEDVSPENNPILKMFVKRFRTTTQFHGNKLFTVENAKRVATPLFVVLLVVETTDIVFAVDSIPAIFGITQDPFIILTSNVFAILGLRALYFLMAEGLNRIRFLQYGLAIILAFVGVKMLLAEVIHISGLVSLAVIVTVLVVTGVGSLLAPAELPRGFDPEDEKIIDPND